MALTEGIMQPQGNSLLCCPYLIITPATHYPRAFVPTLVGISLRIDGVCKEIPASLGRVAVCLLSRQIHLAERLGYFFKEKE
jgi:hypothetical protein